MTVEEMRSALALYCSARSCDDCKLHELTVGKPCYDECLPDGVIKERYEVVFGSEQNAKGCNTLCWECSKGVRECQWMSDLKPIPGWIAEKTVIINGKRRGFQSYCVIKCPLFERSKHDKD